MGSIFVIAIVLLSPMFLPSVRAGNVSTTAVTTGDSYASSVVKTYSQGGSSTSTVESSAVANSGGNVTNNSSENSTDGSSEAFVNISIEGETEVDGYMEAVAGNEKKTVEIDSPGSYKVEAGEGATSSVQISKKAKKPITGINKEENLIEMLFSKFANFLKGLFG